MNSNWKEAFFQLSGPSFFPGTTSNYFNGFHIFFFNFTIWKKCQGSKDQECCNSISSIGCKLLTSCQNTIIILYKFGWFHKHLLAAQNPAPPMCSMYWAGGNKAAARPQTAAHKTFMSTKTSTATVYLLADALGNTVRSNKTLLALKFFFFFFL